MTNESYDNMPDNLGDPKTDAEVLELYIQGLAAAEGITGEHPAIANSYSNIAMAYLNQGYPTTALEWFKKAVAMYERVSGDHSDTAFACNSVAGVYFRQEDYGEALLWCLKSYRILLRLKDRHPDIGTIKKRMKTTYHEAGFTEPFEQWLKRMLDSDR